MKRSEINTILQNAKAFLAASQFHLPPFAAWSPADWQSRGSEASEIVERDLGWDITDFGSGDFDRCGLFLFTLRNGHRTALQTGKGKVYHYNEKLKCVEGSACVNAGGGRVIVPAGLWLTGPIELKSNLNLYLEQGAVVIRAS